LLTQTLIVHMIRAPKLPFLASRASAALTTMTGAISVLPLWLRMGPLGGHSILRGCALLTTGMRQLEIRRFGWR
jgi:Mg2+-importing ATPase